MNKIPLECHHERFERMDFFQSSNGKIFYFKAFCATWRFTLNGWQFRRPVSEFTEQQHLFCKPQICVVKLNFICIELPNRSRVYAENYTSVKENELNIELRFKVEQLLKSLCLRRAAHSGDFCLWPGLPIVHLLIHQEIETNKYNPWKLFKLKCGIAYSGSDGFGCARLLKTKLEVILSWIVCGDRDSGGWGSNAIVRRELWSQLWSQSWSQFCSHIWSQLKQMLIKHVSQHLVIQKL